jgi:putative DNA primase/helicase
VSELGDTSPGHPAPGPDLAAIFGTGSTGAPSVPSAGGSAELHLETPTDTGNSHRLLRLLGSMLRFVPAEDVWLVWDGVRWVRDYAGTALNLTEVVCAEIRQTAVAVPEDQRAEWRAWARASESVTRRKAMLELAGTLPELVVRPEQLDAVPWLLNTPSGVVDLRTLAVRPAAPTDLMTHCTRVPVDLGHVWSPLLAEFQATFQPEPGHWDHLMLALGSCLRGGNAFRVWLLMHGPSTTGKTMLTETIARVLGDYSSAVSTSVFRANQDDKPRPDLLKIMGARFVYAAEGADSWELHADHIKRLAGGDPVVARGMRSNVMVERVPDFTPIIVCNSVPRVKGADQAVRRRLRVLEFRRSIMGSEDPARRELFMADPATLSALLGQMVIGCMRAYSLGIEEGRPTAWVEATADAFAQLTSVTQFLEDLRDAGGLREIESETVSPRHCWGSAELHDVYRLWVEKRGNAEDIRTRLSFAEFRAELQALGWEGPVRANGSRWPGKFRPHEVNIYTLWM